MSLKCQGNESVIFRPGDFFEANMMNSVFSELSLSILHPIHVFSSSIHSLMELNFAARSWLPSAASCQESKLGTKTRASSAKLSAFPDSATLIYLNNGPVSRYKHSQLHLLCCKVKSLIKTGPSPAGRAVVPRPPFEIGVPISRLAPRLLHTSNTVF